MRALAVPFAQCCCVGRWMFSFLGFGAASSCCCCGCCRFGCCGCGLLVKSTSTETTRGCFFAPLSCCGCCGGGAALSFAWCSSGFALLSIFSLFFGASCSFAGASFAGTAGCGAGAFCTCFSSFFGASFLVSFLGSSFLVTSFFGASRAFFCSCFCWGFCSCCCSFCGGFCSCCFCGFGTASRGLSCCLFGIICSSICLATKSAVTLWSSVQVSVHHKPPL